MAISVSNKTKNPIVLDNEDKSLDKTWDETDPQTWDDSGDDTWDVQNIHKTNKTKNAISLTNKSL